MKRFTFIKSLLALPFLGKVIADVEEETSERYDSIPDWNPENEDFWNTVIEGEVAEFGPVANSVVLDENGNVFECEDVINTDGTVTTTYTLSNPVTLKYLKP